MTTSDPVRPGDGLSSTGSSTRRASQGGGVKMTRLSSSSFGLASSSTIEEDTVPMVYASTTKQQSVFRSTNEPRIWRTRPVHHRRASQPVNSSMLRQRVRSDALTNAAEGFSSSPDDSHSNGNSSGESSDEEGQEWRNKHSVDGNLDYLDLSISLPYALVALRDHLLAYTSQLEERMKALYPLQSAAATASESSFYSHLEAFKEELRTLMSALPSPSSAPLIPERASAAIEAGKQSLANDWERLSKSLHTKLAMRPDFHISLPKDAHLRAKALASELPSSALQAITPFHDLSIAALWAPLVSSLPMPHGTNLLVNVQRRFEELQESVRAVTLRDLFFTAKQDEKENARSSSDATSIRRRPRSSSLAASQQAIATQYEAILESIKSKGEEVRLAGHARASSMVKAAREAEERVYASAVELARNGQLLLRYEHLPELWRNNEHILSGYRFIPKEEWLSLLKSTFQIHNETGNIMTHLLGAVVVAPLFWPNKDKFDEQTTPTDRMVQTIYLVAALKCLLLSVSWHVMAGCSDACLFERFACVDYTGIAWLVAASVWTLVYNAFYCQPNLAMVYSLSTLLVGLVGAIVPWQAWFNERQNKPVRIAVFLAMCFTGLAPFTHAILSHGFIRATEFFGAILPSLFAYVFGLVFYAFQVPECFFPGRFDVVGHAHQIWHISIVVAIILHYRATFYWHENRFNFSCALNTPSPVHHSTLLSNPLAVDLNVADEMVHGWRIIAGRIGDGLVGRIWDRSVEALMATFSG